MSGFPNSSGSNPFAQSSNSNPFSGGGAAGNHNKNTKFSKKNSKRGPGKNRNKKRNNNNNRNPFQQNPAGADTATNQGQNPFGSSAPFQSSQNNNNNPFSSAPSSQQQQQHQKSSGKKQWKKKKNPFGGGKASNDAKDNVFQNHPQSATNQGGSTGGFWGANSTASGPWNQQTNNSTPFGASTASSSSSGQNAFGSSAGNKKSKKPSFRKSKKSSQQEQGGSGFGASAWPGASSTEAASTSFTSPFQSSQNPFGPQKSHQKQNTNDSTAGGGWPSGGKKQNNPFSKRKKHQQVASSFDPSQAPFGAPSDNPFSTTGSTTTPFGTVEEQPFKRPQNKAKQNAGGFQASSWPQSTSHQGESSWADGSSSSWSKKKSSSGGGKNPFQKGDKSKSPFPKKKGRKSGKQSTPSNKKNKGRKSDQESTPMVAKTSRDNKSGPGSRKKYSLAQLDDDNQAVEEDTLGTESGGSHSHSGRSSRQRRTAHLSSSKRPKGSSRGFSQKQEEEDERDDLDERDDENAHKHSLQNDEQQHIDDEETDYTSDENDDEPYGSKPFVLPKHTSMIFTASGSTINTNVKPKEARAKEPTQRKTQKSKLKRPSLQAAKSSEGTGSQPKTTTTVQRSFSINQLEEPSNRAPKKKTTRPKLNRPSLPPPQTSQQQEFDVNDILYPLYKEVGDVLSNAHKSHTVGTCMEMCPPEEMRARQMERALSKFEIDYSYVPQSKSDVYRADPDRMVKQYAKASAGTASNTRLIRPMPVLEETLNYLVDNIFGDSQFGIIEMYSFIRDRCRAINQDLTLQNSDGLDAVELLEQITRFHILAEYLFCEDETFSSHVVQNMQLLNKYLISLAELYSDLRSRGIDCEHEVEFHGYMIISLMDDSGKQGKERLECVQYIKKLPQEVIETPHMQSILKLYSLYKQKHYYAFFVHAQTMDYLTLCQLNRNIAPFRMEAVKTLRRAHGKTKYSFEDFINFLKFDSEHQARRFLKVFGISPGDDKFKFPDSIPTKRYDELPLEHSYWIDAMKPEYSHAELLKGILWTDSTYTHHFRKVAVKRAPPPSISTTFPSSRAVSPVSEQSAPSAIPPVADVDSDLSVTAKTPVSAVSSQGGVFQAKTPSPTTDRGEKETTSVERQLEPDRSASATPSPLTQNAPFLSFGTPSESPKQKEIPSPVTVPKFEFATPKVPTPRKTPPSAKKSGAFTFEPNLPSDFMQPPKAVSPRTPQAPPERKKPSPPPGPSPATKRKQIHKEKLEALRKKTEKRILRKALHRLKDFSEQEKANRLRLKKQKEREERTRKNYLLALSHAVDALQSPSSRLEYLYGDQTQEILSQYVRPLQEQRSRALHRLEEQFLAPLEFASAIFFNLASKHLDANKTPITNTLQWKLSLVHNNDQELCTWLASKFSHNPTDSRLLCNLQFQGSDVTIKRPDTAGKNYSEEENFLWFLENMCDESGSPLFDKVQLQTCVRQILLGEPQNYDAMSDEDNSTANSEPSLSHQLRGSSGIVYILPHKTQSDLSVYWREVASDLYGVFNSCNLQSLEREIPFVFLYDSAAFSSREYVSQMIHQICSSYSAMPKINLSVAVIEIPFSSGTLTTAHIQKLESCLLQCLNFLSHHCGKQPQLRSMLLSEFVEECLSQHFNAILPDHYLDWDEIQWSKAKEENEEVKDLVPPLAFSGLISHTNRVIQHCASCIASHLLTLKNSTNWPPPELVSPVDDWASADYLDALFERLSDFTIDTDRYRDMKIDDIDYYDREECFIHLMNHCTQFAAMLLHLEDEDDCPPEMHASIARFLTFVLNNIGHDSSIYFSLFRGMVSYFLEVEDDCRFPVVFPCYFDSEVVRNICTDISESLQEQIPLLPENIYHEWYLVESDENSSSEDDEAAYPTVITYPQVRSYVLTEMREGGSQQDESDDEVRSPLKDATEKDDNQDLSSSRPAGRHVQQTDITSFFSDRVQATRAEKKRKREACNYLYGSLDGIRIRPLLQDTPQALKRTRLNRSASKVSGEDCNSSSAPMEELDGDFDRLLHKIKTENREMRRIQHWIEKETNKS